jgi:hypothetical protein
MASADSAFVLGQRYALTTSALVLALLSFLNFAELEKASVAIGLALQAMKVMPAALLGERRRWGLVAIGLAVAHMALVVTVILLNLDRLARVAEVLRAMSA